MEQKPYNKLDDFFKKAFEEANANPQEESWNVPSDEVWDKLATAGTETTKRKDRPLVVLNRKWLALAASLLLLLIVTGQAIYQRIQLNQQTSKIKTIEAELHDLKEEQKQQDTSPIDTTTTSIDTDKEVFIPKLDIVETQDEVNTAKETSQTSSASRQNIANTKTETSSQNRAAERSNNIESFNETPQDERIISERNEITDIVKNTEEKQQQLPSIQEENNRKVETLVEHLSNTDIALLTSKLSPTPSPILNEMLIEPHQKNKPSITAFFSPVHSVQRFDRRRRDIFQTQTIDENTLNLGLRISQPLDKGFALETGLHYLNSSASRNINPKPKFRRNGERRNSRNDFENDYSLIFSTSEGLVEADVVISRASTSAAPENGKEIDLDATLKVSVQQLQIPALLVYEQRIKRFRWNLKAGLLANIELDKKIAIDAIESNETTFKIERFERKRVERSRQSLEWELYLATALSYQFSPHWAVQLEPSFSKGLKGRELSNSFPGNNNQVFAQAAGVNMGLRYNF